MKRLFRRLLQTAYGAIPRTEKSGAAQHLAGGMAQMQQLQLRLRYQELVRQGTALPSFDEAQFRWFSQNGEDGILLLLFAVLGTTRKRVVEACVQWGVECNAANLIVNHGWSGLLFDGDAGNIAHGRRFYARCPDTMSDPPRLEHAWITAENINDLIRGCGLEGEVDLFSLDVDGMDYWIWKALDVIRPRVVVLEYNNLWGPEDAVTVPYRADFVAEHTDVGPNYAGASLAAFARLGKAKGYRLVGCERLGFNAFFVREGLGEAWFPEVPVGSCLNSPFARRANQHRLPLVRNLAWERV